MADTSTSMDVEDVLTSIRRLVSEEAKGTPRAARKLVLTNPAPELEETPEFPAPDLPEADAEAGTAQADGAAMRDEEPAADAGDDLDRELSEALDRDPGGAAPEPLVLTPSLRIAGGAEGGAQRGANDPASADPEAKEDRQDPAAAPQAETAGPIPQPEDFGIDAIVDVMVEAEEPHPAPPARDKPRRRWGFPTGLLRGHRGHEGEDDAGTAAPQAGAEGSSRDREGPEPLVTVRRRTPRPRPLSLEDLIQQTTGRGAAGGAHDAGQERQPALHRNRRRAADAEDGGEGRVLHLGQPHADASAAPLDGTAGADLAPESEGPEGSAQGLGAAEAEDLAEAHDPTLAAAAEAPLDDAHSPGETPLQEADSAEDPAAPLPQDPDMAQAPDAPSADILPPESAELSLMPEEADEAGAGEASDDAAPSAELPDVEETLLDAIRLAADLGPAAEEADRTHGAEVVEEADGGADELAAVLPDDPGAEVDAATLGMADAPQELAEAIDPAHEDAELTGDEIKSFPTQDTQPAAEAADAAGETDWSQLLATATAAGDAEDDAPGATPEAAPDGAPRRSASGKMLGPISDDVWDRLRSVAAEQGAEPILKAMGGAAGNDASARQAPEPAAPDMILPEGALDPLPKGGASHLSPPERAEPAEETFEPDARSDEFAEDDDEMVLDEESLREMVVTILREELRGELGDRITQNVRKLVRREINRALAARDFK